MGGFPALPSGNNPSVSAASGYAGAAASVYNSLQSRLQQAANQHATLLRQKQVDEQTANQRESEYQLQVQKAGAIPVNLPPSGDRGTGHDDVTLQRPESNPAVPKNGQGQTLTSPKGEKYYMPTEKEQGKAFVPTGGLAGALQGAGWDGKTPITPEHSHSIMQALELAQPKDEPYDIDTSGKFTDAQGNPTPVMIGRKTGRITMLNMTGAPTQPTAAPASQGAGLPGGAFSAPAQTPATPAPTGLDQYSNGPFTTGGPAATPAPAAAAPVPSPAQPTAAPAQTPAPGGVRFALPEKNEPTDQQIVIPGKKGPKGGMIVWNKKTKMTEEVPFPEGTSDELTAEQKERKQEFNTRQGETSTRQSEVKENRAARISAELGRYNDKLTDRKEKAKAALKKANADAVTDEDKNSAARDYKQELQQAQTEYETNLGTTLGKPIDHNPWADNLPDGATPPKTSAKPTSAPAKPTSAPAKPASAPVKPAAAAPATKAQRTPPPASVTKGLAPGRHTFGNGQTWHKKADGTMEYVSGGQ